MKQYIDKEVLIAEIERRKQTWQHQDQQYVNGGKDVCNYLLGFLDTLEVKEVDSNDAFIEKACEWLKENFSFDKAGYIKTNIYSTKNMIHSFKNALEDKL